MDVPPVGWRLATAWIANCPNAWPAFYGKWTRFGQSSLGHKVGSDERSRNQKVMKKQTVAKAKTAVSRLAHPSAFPNRWRPFATGLRFAICDPKTVPTAHFRHRTIAPSHCRKTLVYRSKTAVASQSHCDKNARLRPLCDRFAITPRRSRF
jgi:hypothetical protein